MPENEWTLFRYVSFMFFSGTFTKTRNKKQLKEERTV